MRWSAVVEPAWSLDAWRTQARRAWAARVPPEAIDWREVPDAGLLRAIGVDAAPPVRGGLHVPERFLELASTVLCHRNPGRHALLYRALWRLGEGGARLLERATDPDVHRLDRLARAVRRDTHKMKAFVRFRAIPHEHDAFAAWFEPEHFVVDRVAPFFMRRFAGMRWSILTPYRSAVWDGAHLWMGPGGARDEVPNEDAGESLWKTYYANIFNPARLNLRMMRQEMAQKYWKLLPETDLLPELVRDAGRRVQAMADRVPESPRRRIPRRSAGHESP